MERDDVVALARGTYPTDPDDPAYQVAVALGPALATAEREWQGPETERTEYAAQVVLLLDALESAVRVIANEVT